MEERLFPTLLRIQPDVVELTKEDYEKRMGIRPKGGEVKKVEDVGHAVGEDKQPEVKPQVRADSKEATRQEAIKTLRGRGFDYKVLKTKTKRQLLEML